MKIAQLLRKHLEKNLIGFLAASNTFSKEIFQNPKIY
jgi:hypothetical protein